MKISNAIQRNSAPLNLVLANMAFRNLGLKHLSRIALAICVSMGAAFSAQAESVAIPLGQQSKAWQVETPRSGTTKSQVQAQYGNPLKEMGPIGTPAIYVWDYQNFTVYFEGNSVIHSVVKYQPK